MALLSNHAYLMLFTILFVFDDLIGENRHFRFCEITEYRDLTFKFQSVIELFYIHSQTMCALFCVGLTECTWFSFNINSTKCSIFNVPTFQNAGPGMIELDAKHYALAVSKNYFCIGFNVPFNTF